MTSSSVFWYLLCLSFTLNVAADVSPPPRSRGTIDFRYPDYIVDPRPKCPSEGVFHHPRNCTWYYRCHDPFGFGFYHQTYYECEPGTVFFDDLDQCIHPYNVPPPCGINGAVNTTSTSTSTSSTTSTTTTNSPDTTKTPDCHSSYELCKSYICDENEVYLCQRAKKECGNKVTFYCDEDNVFYHFLTRECVPSPFTRNCMEKTTAAPTTATSTTTATPLSLTVTSQKTIHCSSSNVRPQEPWIQKELCSNYHLCESGNYKGKVNLCDSYYQCRKIDDKWETMKMECPTGLLFSYNRDKCEEKPTNLCI